MNLLLQNNICKADQDLQKAKEIVYAPIYRSQKQLDFFKQRYEQLKQKYPNTIFSTQLAYNELDLVYCWDSEYEIKFFKNKVSKYQNRLFDTLPFNIANSFTNFKKNAEPLLPKYFEDVEKPFDKEVLKEIDYYFSNKKLPMHYFDTRNEMVGRDNSTKFSAYLSCGFLDVKYLYNRVKDFEVENGSNKSTYWIVFELLWREFFYWHYQKNTNKYFSKNGLKGELDFSYFPKYKIEDLKRMKAHNFFYCALRELEETGFLSNRARQMFASIWINDLSLDWRSGALLFETYLIDYDVYSNYGNWMYLAGVGVDPRGKRYFNTQKQLEQYDKESKYMKQWS